MTEKNEARVRTRAPMVPIGAKTLLSLLMAVVMLVGLLPVTALAAPTTGSGTKDDPYIVTTYAELKAKLQSKETTYIKVTGMDHKTSIPGSTTRVRELKVGEDFENLSAAIDIPEGAHKYLEIAADLRFVGDGQNGVSNYPEAILGRLIDLNAGASLTITGNGSLRVDFNAMIARNAIIVNWGGNLTIDGDVTLDARQEMFRNIHGTALYLEAGTTNIRGGTFWGGNYYTTVSAGGGGAIHVPKSTAAPKLNISGGTFKAENAGVDAAWMYGLDCKNTNAKVSLAGGTFESGIRSVGNISELLAEDSKFFKDNAVFDGAVTKTKDPLSVQRAATLKDLTLNVGSTSHGASDTTFDYVVGSDNKLSVSFNAGPEWFTTDYKEGRVNLNAALVAWENGALKTSVRFTPVTDYKSDGSVDITLNVSGLDLQVGKTYTIYAYINPHMGDTKLADSHSVAQWTIKAVEKSDTVISSVNLTGDALKEGDTNGPTLTKADSDTGYSFTQSAWNITGSAAAGKEYYTSLNLTAVDGYVFPTDWDKLRSIISVQLGDKTITKLGLGLADGGKTLSLTVYATADHNHSWGDWKKDEDGHYKECSSCKTVSDKEAHNWGNWMNSETDGKATRTCSVCGYSEERTIGERPISFLKINIIRPVAGATPDASNLTIRDAYVDQVEIVDGSVQWCDESGNPVTGAFEKGKSYTIKAQFKPKGELTFAETITTAGLFFITDETITLSADKKTVDYSCTFKAYESTTVDTALPTLVIGEAMPLPTVADGRAYSVFVMYTTGAGSLASLSYDSTENKWKDSSNADVTGDGLKVKAAVYYYSCTIKEGDNEKVTARLTGTGNSTVSSAAGNGVSASYTINAEDKITSVELTVTAPEYGKAPATTAAGADNAKYTVGTPTWSPAVTDNKFGADTYTVSIPVTEETGYSFAEGCIYTVNGYSATYADGKVSYTFPALTAPHSHNYGVWKELDDSFHYQTCSVASCDEPTKVEEHSFGDWTPDTADATRHYKECSVCHHKVYANHEESARITDTAAGIGIEGKWHTKCEVCGKTMSSGTIAALEQIKKAEVTVTAPVRNAAPTNAAVKDTETRYYVADTEWEPVVTDKFASGTKYTVKVTLEANDGYAFKGDGIFGIGDTTFTINGNKAKVVSGDAQQVVITYEFPATGSGSYNGGTGSGGTTTNKPVKSARTGDPGVMLYAAMGLLSLSGGAWIVGRKRKDK